MKLELKNDTLLVKFDAIAEYKNLIERARMSGLVLSVEMSDLPTIDNLNATPTIPVLLGEIVEMGPGKPGKEKRQMPPELSIGKKILFQVANQLAYKDRELNCVFYVIGVGNVLGLVED